MHKKLYKNSRNFVNLIRPFAVYLLDMDETELLVEAQKGSVEAVDELLQWARNYSYRIAYYLLLEREEAEEVAQECAWRFFKNLDKLDPSGSLKGWVRKVSLNLVMDHFRKRKRLADFGASELTDVNPSRGGNFIDLERCMAVLSPLQRTVISLFYIENMPVRDIAALLGIAEGTVKSHLFRGREKLKKCFKELGLL